MDIHYFLYIALFSTWCLLSILSFLIMEFDFSQFCRVRSFSLQSVSDDGRGLLAVYSLLKCSKDQKSAQQLLMCLGTPTVDIASRSRRNFQFHTRHSDKNGRLLQICSLDRHICILFGCLCPSLWAQRYWPAFSPTVGMGVLCTGVVKG